MDKNNILEGKLDPLLEKAIADWKKNPIQVTYNPPLTGLQLRGSLYMVRFREIAPTLCGLHSYLYEQYSKITPRMVIEMSDTVGLPLKTTTEFLEMLTLLPTGTWERLRNRGFKKESEKQISQ